MIFVNDKGDSLEFDIEGYQFEGHSEDYDFNWDANWLIVKIVLDKDGYKNEYQSACILTNELKQFFCDLDKLKSHKITSCELNAIEPYLNIDANFDKYFEFKIQFIYGTMGERLNFECLLNENEMEYICNEFNVLCEKYKMR